MPPAGERRAGERQPEPARPRSFVRREGRITPGQQRGLELYTGRYGVEPPNPPPLNLDRLFGRRARRLLEIGFGNGESLLTQAQTAPADDFLGVEVHRPGVGHLLHRLAALQLDNVRVIGHDAVEVLHDWLGDACLDRVQIFFPDPWPKKRHHKRRLIQPPLVDLLARRLKPGGELHLATDWQPYAEQMLEVLSAESLLANRFADGGYAPRPPWRPQTKFERRGLNRGHAVRDIIFYRRSKLQPD